MALIEGVGDFSVFLIVVLFIIALYMLKLAHELKEAILQKSKMLDSKISNLESKAVSVRREVLDLHKNINQKLDREEFEKRLDGLIGLVGKKRETEKKKDAR